MKYSFVLPFPPSVNGLFGGGSRQKRFPSKAYKAWLKACEPLSLYRSKILNDSVIQGDVVKSEPISYPVIIGYRYFWPDKRIRDGQNFMKAPLDYLVKQGILADDNWNIVTSEFWISGGIDKENPRVEIQIEPVKREVLLPPAWSVQDD